MNKAFSSYKTWILWKASPKREGKSGAQEDGCSELIPSFSLPLVSNVCHVGYKTFLRYTRLRKHKEMRSRFGQTNHCVVSPSLVSVWFWNKERPRNDEERDFRFWPREKWNESPSRSLTRSIFREVFDSRSSFVAPKTRKRLIRSLY